MFHTFQLPIGNMFFLNSVLVGNLLGENEMQWHYVCLVILYSATGKPKHYSV